MNVIVNGDPTGLADTATVADLLTARFDTPRPSGIAVARNGEVVPRDEHAGTRLVDGDRIEIVAAVQGG